MGERNSGIATLGEAADSMFEEGTGTAEPGAVVEAPPEPACVEGAWLFLGSDDLAGTLVEFAREGGATVSRLDNVTEFSFPKGALVIIELPGDGREGAIEAAAKAGAVVVAVLDEPTIDWFSKVVKAGAVDVLVANPTPDCLARHIEKWKQKQGTASSDG